jgi:hypothetical protein
MVETTASDIIVTDVLLQHVVVDVLQLVAYFSVKHSLAEINHEIHDKELFTIAHSFK